MAGQVALVGGDEFRAGCEEMDRAVLRATGVARPEVLIVPTAAAFESPSKAASNGVAYFSSLGAEASALMVLGPGEAADEELVAPVDTADVVYLTGGNPVHLLETLRGSRLLEKLRQALERGAVLAGSSAGAMVLGSWMRFREWTESLAVVPGVAVLPHHERGEPSVVAGELERTAPSGAVVLGIDGMTCCFGSADGWQALGSGAVTLYSEGEWAQHRHGDPVPVSNPTRASDIRKE